SSFHSSFFLSRSTPPRDLPSFPTRRSSDLDLFPLSGAGVCGLACSDGTRLTSLRADRRTLPPRPSPLEAGDDLFLSDRAAEALRSEEHTSELQSQSNLVCRLLLEKKKKETN